MPRPDRPVSLRLGFVAAATVAVAYLVARDGSVAWQLVRGLAAVVAGGVAVLLILRASPRRRSLGLLLVGAAGTALGAGMAASWLAKAGMGIVTAAGLLALVAGLVSLGLGIQDLAGGQRGWVRWLTVLALVTVATVFLLALSIAIAGTNVPPTALAGDTPAERGLAYEDAFFTTADGVTLSGWYVPSQNGAAVAMLHGAGSTRANTLDHAAVLARAGYGVLLFDARGHGESEGRAMDFGWFGDADVAAALDYLAARPEVDPARLALVGFSMGGEEAIGAAAADTRVRGVVAEGAVGRSAADHAWLSDAYGFRGWVQRGVDAITYWFADLLTSAGPPLPLRQAVVAMAPRPLLLITAGKVTDEQLAAAHLEAASPEAVTVWEVPGADHIGGLAAAPDEWADRVLAFLDDLLLAPSRG